MASGSVSLTKRLAQVGLAVLWCLTSAGTIFGFQALKSILVAEGVYEDACEGRMSPCLEQDARLNLLFTISSTLTNLMALPIGALLDKIGPRKTSMIGAVVLTCGNLAFGSNVNSGYLIGFSLLAIGGPMIFLPCFHLSNAFPKQSGLILSAITGAFDASCMPYVLYREAYQRRPISLRHFFWSYAVVGLLGFVAQIFLGTDMPYEADDTDRESESGQQTEQSPLLARESAEEGNNSSSFSRMHYGSSRGATDDGLNNSKLGSKDPLVGQLFGQSASKQINSAYFYLITIFLCLTMTRINFYIETAQYQLFFYTKDVALTQRLTTAFVYLLPLGGLCAIPFIGVLLDRWSSYEAFLVSLLFGLLYGCLTLTGSAIFQVAGITVLVVLRPLMYTAVSDYCAKVFGFVTFGRVYGLTNSIAGLFGLVQYPLDLLTKYALKGNPTVLNVTLMFSATLANIALLARIRDAEKK